MCVYVREGEAAVKAGPALINETLPTFKGYFRLSPLIKVSITWVNRGQWEKNTYLHRSLSFACNPHADTHCRPVWLPVRKSPSPRQVPLSPTTIFPAMSDMRILMNAQWQYLGRQAAILPLQIYCRSLLFDKEEETAETNRCGSETHLLSKIKNSSFKPCGVIEPDSWGSPCKWRWDYSHWVGPMDREGPNAASASEILINFVYFGYFHANTQSAVTIQ